ncbi:MAG: hypothetical protein AMXMBFR56_70100 [Polyangiaceae bacterium]
MHQYADELRARLEQEARVLSEIKNPHMVTVFDAGELDGRIWMAMELLEGKTLRELLMNGKPLPVAREGRLRGRRRHRRRRRLGLGRQRRREPRAGVERDGAGEDGHDADCGRGRREGRGRVGGGRWSESGAGRERRGGERGGSSSARTGQS